MRLVNVESGLGYGVREHTNNKMPKYITSAEPKRVVIDGKDQNFWLRPNKPDSDRVNLLVDGKWCYIDSPILHSQVDKAEDGKLQFRLKSQAPEAAAQVAAEVKVLKDVKVLKGVKVLK